MIRYTVGPVRPQAPLRSRRFRESVLADGTLWTEFYRVGAGYLLRFPGLADFEVSADGATVAAHPVEGVDADTIEHLYLNQVVPLALSRQDRPAFHASVVAVPGGCVAFLGRSGMGKSTLAASFSLGDAPFLTDDALIVSESGGVIVAAPGPASIRLWNDSVEALIEADSARSSRVSYSSKARLLAGQALTHGDSPLPLLSAYLLEPVEPARVTFRPLEGVSRHMAWVENSFLLDTEDRGLVARHFEWTHHVASLVPTFALSYERDYRRLGEVRRTILQHVAGIVG